MVHGGVAGVKEINIEALLIRVGMVKLWKKETKQEGEEIDGAACIQA